MNSRRTAIGSYQVLGVAVDDSRAAVTEYVKEAKIVFPSRAGFK